MGNLSIPQFNFYKLLEKHDLIPFLSRLLVVSQTTSAGGQLNSMISDDILLEVVIFIGTLASDEDCAPVLVDSGLIAALVCLLNTKQEDDEMVLQIVYVFYQLIFHERTRHDILMDEEEHHHQSPHRPSSPTATSMETTTTPSIVAYLIDLMHDKNTEVRRMCESALDIIAETDSAWATRVRHEKFKWHNAQWLHMVQENHEGSAVAGDGGEGDVDVHHQYGGGHVGTILEEPELYDPDEDDMDYLQGEY